MSKSPLDYLRHILDECDYVVSVITEDTVKDDLLDNETLKRAVVRSLEIIGEATKKYPLISKPSGQEYHGEIWQE